MNSKEELIECLETHLPVSIHSSSGGLDFEFPDFELTPFDYLDFAEQDLAVGSTSSKIGCVSNLKRATECEMDTLLHILGLSDKIRSFPRKLEFIGKAGLVSPRSLEKLNKIRNKMEHEYATPEIQELESYFDLASGFVHSIEGYIFMLFTHAEQEWVPRDDHSRVALQMKLQTSPPGITFDFRLQQAKNILSFEAEHMESYIFGLKTFFLMCRAIRLVSCEYVMGKLKDDRVWTGAGRNFSY